MATTKTDTEISDTPPSDPPTEPGEPTLAEQIAAAVEAATAPLVAKVAALEAAPAAGAPAAPVVDPYVPPVTVEPSAFHETTVGETVLATPGSGVEHVSITRPDGTTQSYATHPETGVVVAETAPAAAVVPAVG